MFGVAHVRHLNTQNFFLANVYEYFLLLRKNSFPSFQDFFPKNMLVLSQNVFSNYNTFLIECSEGPFLDVNLKTMFFEGQEPQSQQQ